MKHLDLVSSAQIKGGKLLNIVFSFAGESNTFEEEI